MFGMFSLMLLICANKRRLTRRVAICAFEARDNPYATALDLQNFTDSLVGLIFLRPGTQLARHWSVLRQKTKRTV